MRGLLCSTLVVGSVVGCADPKSVIEPGGLDDKADVSSRVSDRGAIELGAARAGQFNEDLEFHGYTLAVRVGARVTIDNTHAGTASALDSTLFLYGPRTAEGFGTDAIAFDDDSGWGRHARIRSHRFVEGGEYLVVLGTASGRGRGHYQLVATCESGDCTPVPTQATCDAGLSAGIQHCIARQIGYGDVESEFTPSYADALEVCTDGEAMGGIRDARCAESPAPEFCALDFESFEASQTPPCRAELGARAGLCGEYLGEALALATDGLLFTSESDYPYTFVAWAGQGPPTGASVLALSGLAADSELGTRTLADQFEWIGRAPEPGMDPDALADLLRHRHLRRVLEGNLRQTLVVRIGEIQVRVFMVGLTSCGEVAGVSTTSIET